MASRGSVGTSAAWVVVLATSTLACASREVPDPNEALARYVAAAKAGDANALYGMMSEGARRERSASEVARIVESEKLELAEYAARLSSETKVKSEATLRYADGEKVTLTYERGTFRIDGAGALPSGAKTPDLALDQLRRVLARRSYAGVLRVVTAQAREALENDFRSLVRGLEHPETLPIRVEGDTADVAVPGGHHVRLKRQGGVWRIDDFD